MRNRNATIRCKINIQLIVTTLFMINRKIVNSLQFVILQLIVEMRNGPLDYRLDTHIKKSES